MVRTEQIPNFPKLPVEVKAEVIDQTKQRTKKTKKSVRGKQFDKYTGLQYLRDMKRMEDEYEPERRRRLFEERFVTKGQVPDELKCPLTGNLMEKPVLYKGVTYEKDAIIKYLKETGQSKNIKHILIDVEKLNKIKRYNLKEPVSTRFVDYCPRCRRNDIHFPEVQIICGECIMDIENRR